MGRTTDFTKINDVAHICWTMKTQTPLCIKSGTTSGWQQASSDHGGKNNKLREVNASFDFFQKVKDSDSERISDFYFDTIIENNTLQIQYRIPSSSIRGALRGYTIKHLVPEKDWKADMTTVLKDLESETEKQKVQENHRRHLQDALKQPGWHLIQNLFGLAVDSGDTAADKETVAGRLQIETGDLARLSKDEFKKSLLSGTWRNFKPGSTHGCMVISTRSPIDRITHAAKDGGLHSFMELAPGNRFDVNLRIANPLLADLGFIAFWENGIKDGLLRLGGLTAAGRGRMKISSTAVTLYLRSAKNFTGLEPLQPASRDILDTIFTAYTVDNWDKSKNDYLEHLKRHFAASVGRVSVA